MLSFLHMHETNKIIFLYIFFFIFTILYLIIDESYHNIIINELNMKISIAVENIAILLRKKFVQGR